MPSASRSTTGPLRTAPPALSPPLPPHAPTPKVRTEIVSKMANRLVGIASLLEWMTAKLWPRAEDSIGDSPGRKQGHALGRSPTPRPRGPTVVLLIGMLLGLAVLALARAHPDGSLAGRSTAGALALIGAGWGLVAAGVVAWRRWPQSRFGALLAAAGLAWMLAELPNPEVGSALLFTVGLVTFAVAPPLVAHAALAYPGGRIDRTSERAALAAGFASTIGVLGLLHALVFDPHADGCNFCPANLLTVDAGGAAADFVLRGGLVLGVVSSAGMIVVL